MKNGSHSKNPDTSQRVHAARARLDQAERNDLEWPELRACKRAYFAAMHALSDTEYDPDNGKYVPDYTGPGYMRAVTKAQRDHEAAGARLAAVENNPDATASEYVEAAVAESNADERHSLIGMQWEGHLEWQREQRLQSARPRVRVKLKPRRYSRSI